MSMATLPISVVIIAKDAERTLDECLSAVQQNNPAEIIVVDDHSRDRTAEIARGYTETVCSLATEGKGICYARQFGAELASQEYVGYVDSDVILAKGALPTMLAEFQSSNYISISAGEPPDIESSSYWEWAQREQARLAHPTGSEPGIGMACSLFRRATLLRYGFELGYGGFLDDGDLEIRMKRDGHRFGLSSALMYHYCRADLKSLVRHHFSFARLIRPYYVLKYGPWHAGFWPPLSAAYWIAVCLARGKWKLIPYHIVDGATQTAGIAKGVVELMGEWTVRKLAAFRRIRQ